MQKENAVIKQRRHPERAARRVSGSSTHDVSQRQQQAWKIPIQERDDRPLLNNGNNGFTLIELLVVVLIIGILAAVAVPQYQKAVEKSRAAQAISLVKSIYQAEQSYYLANNTWPTDFDELAVEIPWTGNGCVHCITSNPKRSNGQWALELYKDSANQFAVSVGRTSGPYRGTGFMIFTKGDSFRKPGQLLCFERYTFDGNAGDYCQKIMKAGQRTCLGSNLDVFSM